MYGERIRELRIEKGLTQEQLGKRLNCDQRTISKYELEDVDLGTHTIIKLCDIFQVTSDYILGLEDETGAKKFR